MNKIAPEPVVAGTGKDFSLELHEADKEAGLRLANQLGELPGVEVQEVDDVPRPDNLTNLRSTEFGTFAGAEPGTTRKLLENPAPPLDLRRMNLQVKFENETKRDSAKEEETVSQCLRRMIYCFLAWSVTIIALVSILAALFYHEMNLQ